MILLSPTVAGFLVVVPRSVSDSQLTRRCMPLAPARETTTGFSKAVSLAATRRARQERRRRRGDSPRSAAARRASSATGAAGRRLLESLLFPRAMPKAVDRTSRTSRGTLDALDASTRSATPEPRPHRRTLPGRAALLYYGLRTRNSDMPVVFQTPLCLNQFFLTLWATVDDICENNRVARGALFGGCSAVFFALTFAVPMFEYLLDSTYDIPRPLFSCWWRPHLATHDGGRETRRRALAVMNLIKNAASAPIDRIEDGDDVESGGSSDKDD